MLRSKSITPAASAEVSAYQPPFVILKAVKNLVPYQDVSPFPRGECPLKKGAIWVLKDEILHCFQNDKGEALYFHFDNQIGGFGYCRHT
jgi:hypothetical protein